MNRPNLFIIGAPKCGTTAWHHYLGQHADISFSGAKEPHYFSHDFPGFQWAKSETQYLDLFRSLPSARYIGEASVMYLYSTVAIKNIFRFNPKAKLIAFTRSYPDFLVSYHSQIFLSLDEEIACPEQAWASQLRRAKGQDIPANCREPKFLQYREVCKFGAQLKRLFDVFPGEQVRLVPFERWTENPRQTYLELLSFLGLEDNGFDDFRPINTKRQTRSRMLSKLVRRPPATLLAASRLVRTLFGLKRLGLANRVRQLNEQNKKTHAKLSPSFIKKIELEMSEDKKLLNRLLSDKALSQATIPKSQGLMELCLNQASSPLGESKCGF